MISSLIFAILLFSSSPCTEEQNLPTLIESDSFRVVAAAAIDSLYNRKPAAAGELMKPWREDCPDHPIWDLWEAMELWWTVLTDLHDVRHDDRFFETMEKADEAAKALLESNPDHVDGHIIRAVANGYTARHLANRNRWVRSVRTARHAMRAHDELGRLAPDLTDNLFAEGMKKYYSAWLPDNYAVLRPFRWVLPDGDRQEGLRLLDETSRTAVFSRPEAIYFSGLIQLRYEERYAEARERFEQLVEMYPDNSYYRRMLARAYFEQREYNLIEQLTDQSEHHWKSSRLEDHGVMMEELLFWKGRSQMRQGMDRQALITFDRSWAIGRKLPNQSERTFQVLSGYFAGRAAESLGELEQARIYYERVVRLDGEPGVRRDAETRLERL